MTPAPIEQLLKASAAAAAAGKSAETRAKMSAAHMGAVYTAERNAKVSAAARARRRDGSGRFGSVIV